ncbi:hypothetical protein DPMN_053698 [Dreissena polymorpha]|uniref:Uncharacterized protein n=1 Tax=Dreissena polymorpha TaxID=45954 RepID=A0A9D4CLV2_DREPO|nr:hypothetical protein DPMN_053698 [Dreissena polymorpha]
MSSCGSLLSPVLNRGTTGDNRGYAGTLPAFSGALRETAGALPELHWDKPSMALQQPISGAPIAFDPTNEHVLACVHVCEEESVPITPLRAPLIITMVARPDTGASKIPSATLPQKLPENCVPSARPTKSGERGLGQAKAKQTICGPLHHQGLQFQMDVYHAGATPPQIDVTVQGSTGPWVAASERTSSRMWYQRRNKTQHSRKSRSI